MFGPAPKISATLPASRPDLPTVAMIHKPRERLRNQSALSRSNRMQQRRVHHGSSGEISCHAHIRVAEHSVSQLLAALQRMPAFEIPRPLTKSALSLLT